MLRFDGPANTNGRVAHTDIEIGGKVIGAGQVLLCMLGAANRDPLVFEAPDRFDVGRTPNPHVSFGGGIHHCLGAALARLEATVALERILARLAHFEAVEERVVWRDLVNIRGLSTLPMRVEWKL
jgi:cytochrome P450